jgi:hypothetical protein
MPTRRGPKSCAPLERPTSFRLRRRCGRARRSDQESASYLSGQPRECGRRRALDGRQRPIRPLRCDRLEWQPHRPADAMRPESGWWPDQDPAPDCALRNDAHTATRSVANATVRSSLLGMSHTLTSPVTFEMHRKPMLQFHVSLQAPNATEQCVIVPPTVQHERRNGVRGHITVLPQ